MKTLILTILISVAAYAQPKNNKPASTSKNQSVNRCLYTCLMDKDVCSSMPGRCPKCGMKMVKKAR